MKSKVRPYSEVAPHELGGGVTRRVLAWLPEQMMVEVCFEQGAIGAEHTHPHTQCTYVLEGEFDFTVDGRVYRVRRGDTLAFASGERHGCICVEKGKLLDVFTPMREDFLK